MSLTVHHECPLGGQCDRIEAPSDRHPKGRIVRCAWYTRVQGRNPETQEIQDSWGCAMAFLPILLVDNTVAMGRVQTATESGRNETVTGLLTVVDEIARIVRRPKLIGEGDGA